MCSSDLPIECPHQSEQSNNGIIPFGLRFRFLTCGMGVSRDNLIYLRIFLAYLMLRAQKLLETVDIIDCKVIKFDFIATTPICPDIQLVSHQCAFQDSQVLDAPLRNIFLCDVIFKYVEEVRLTRLPFLLFRFRMQKQVILNNNEILCQRIGWCFLAEIDKEPLNVDQPVLYRTNFGPLPCFRSPANR